MLTTKISRGYKKWLIAFFVLVITGGVVLWYIFNEKFIDTVEVKSDYTVNALDFIKEFKTDISLANKKYSEKIIVVNGIVSEVVPADTSANIIMKDTASEAYIIFAFQLQHLSDAKLIKEGERISIKGSCSNGVYSEILETENISFKRCAVYK